MDIKVKLSEASAAQLRYFATVVLGMSLPKLTNAKQMLSRIQDVHEGDTITVPDHIAGNDAAPVAKTAPKAKAEQAGEEEASLSPAERAAREEQRQAARDAEWIEIIIPRSDSPGGKQPVPVSVNGRNQHIPRGRKVAIRFPYLHALENAVQHIYEMDDNNQQMKPEPTEVRSYEFSILRRGLSEAEARQINATARAGG